MIEKEEYSISESELAERWGCSKNTLRRMRKGKAPVWWRVGNRVRYSLRSVEEWEKKSFQG